MNALMSYMNVIFSTSLKRVGYKRLFQSIRLEALTHHYFHNWVGIYVWNFDIFSSIVSAVGSYTKLRTVNERHSQYVTFIYYLFITVRFDELNVLYSEKCRFLNPICNNVYKIAFIFVYWNCTQCLLLCSGIILKISEWLS